MRHWIVNRVKRFIVRTVIENIGNNGEIRQAVVREDFGSAAIVGGNPAPTYTPRRVRAGSAFKTSDA